MKNNHPKSSLSIPTGLPSDYKADERILAPIPGVVTKVYIKAGEQVKAGDPLLVIEAMKMRNTFRSAHDGTVAEVKVKEKDVVKAGQMLVEFEKKSV
jgi:propionyl-CoA carboxylase alpha chain